MKYHAIPLTVILCLNSYSVMAGEIEDRTQKSKGVIKEFFTELKSELQTALKTGGPTEAIKICNQVAPAIAAKHSQNTGWTVARTSLKTRNSKNAPDAWERNVLEKFEARKAAGEDVKTMDHAEIIEVDGKRSFRYMKAIPTAEKPCLMCHGTNIKPEVIKMLDQHYSEDKARGYKAGDIRGAFSITQPM